MKGCLPAIIFLAFACLIVGSLMGGLKLGILTMEKEAVERHKAEYLTNEAGDLVWRWLP